MKKLLIAAIVMLGTFRVSAQPQLLSCTETAFNFSFSLGSRLKISTPQMGPAEILRDEYDFIPGWSLKVNYVAPETHLLTAVKLSFNTANPGYMINQPKHNPLPYLSDFGLLDKSRYSSPVFNFTPTSNYLIFYPRTPLTSTPLLRE
jgi:hypothetical protein